MKIVQFIKDLIERIKNLWNIYGGFAISTFIAWLTSWSKIEMDRWSSYLLLTITCISLLTFFKVIIGKRNKTIPDKVIFQQRNIKTINTALNPEAIGEEIGIAILYTIKGGKKMKDKLTAIFKVIWGNKFTSLSLLFNLIYTGASQFLLYSDKLKTINFFVENRLMCIIVATSISVIWLIIELVKDFKNYGFESLAVLNAKWAKRKAEKEAKLTKEQKAIVKEQIGDIEEVLKTIVAYRIEAENKLNEINATIKKAEDFSRLGLTLEPKLQNAYNLALAGLEKYEGDVQRLSTEEKNTRTKLEELKAKL